IDRLRRKKLLERKHEELGRETETAAMPDETALDDDVGDDLLRLVFISCHPVLSPEGRAALTLRLLGGLTTPEIARAFLVPEATIAQRIVRAKRTLADAHVPFEVPRGAELGERLASVLEVIYLVFNEGYTATAGDDWLRPALCEEALRLGRILAGLAPDEPEVHGLVGLMEIQASRARARVGPAGAVTRRGAEPGGGGGDGRRPPGRPGPGGRPGRGAGAGGLPPVTERAWRPAGQTGPPGRGPPGVRAGGRPDPQRPRARAAPRPGRRVCAVRPMTRPQGSPTWRSSS